ncbi:hypothetical protein LCGC14_0805880 [marine sediment metagenome]|uniref:Band 7 domain-containing protein n=1 Tax=marine sediment metagenome TaxID=412755 RepID=A0A0F9PSS7_9ZZZZ
MKIFTRFMTLIAVLALFIVFAGCTERVPPGYIGMVQTPDGLTGKVLQPGNHTAYNRDRMILVSMEEVTKTEKMEVLCLDDLNMKFDLEIRSRLKIQDGKSLKAVLKRQGAKIRWIGDSGRLAFGHLYNTYVQKPAVSIARSIVSRYNTTDIRKNRKEIEKAIRDELLLAVKGTPVEITMVVTSNLDYPPVITRAMTLKKEREIEIGREKATQAIKLLQVKNRLKIAQQMKITRAAEAEAEATYNLVMGKSLTKEYLRLREIEAKLKLYDKIDGNTIIITDGASQATPLINIGK